MRYCSIFARFPGRKTKKHVANVPTLREAKKESKLLEKKGFGSITMRMREVNRGLLFVTRWTDRKRFERCYDNRQLISVPESEN